MSKYNFLKCTIEFPFIPLIQFFTICGKFPSNFLILCIFKELVFPFEFLIFVRNVTIAKN